MTKDMAGAPPARRRSGRRRIARIGNTTDAVLVSLFPRSYRAKLMTVVLACIGVPMLCLVAWLIANNGMPAQILIAGTILGLTATVVGTILSLLMIYRLLQPVRRAVAALDAYERDQSLPDWSFESAASDDMGRLLRGIHRCLHTVDAGLRQLERHAMEDALTHAMNRRGARQALYASVEAAARDGAPFVLCVVDLDNLKTINDEHGHAAGDYALASLVESARECCLGRSDWIGRWGGDEFLLGLHADPAIAMDRVRAWIEVLARPADGLRPVQVSAGCAALARDERPAELYRHADAAMYRAKAAGGQRLAAHGDEAVRPGLSSVECA